MTDWFRSWHGAPTDQKWGMVAASVGCKPAEVASLAWALMDYASQAAERGSIKGFGVRLYSFSSGTDKTTVDLIMSEMADPEVGFIDGDRLKSWDKRQPKREDNSSERVKKHRERQKTAENDEERGETQGNAPEEEQSREEDTPKPPIDEAFDLWNAMAKSCGLAEVERRTDQRRDKLRARLNEHGLDGWKAALEKIRSNPWMHGSNDRGWRADFDFLMSPSKFVKLIEGGFDRAGKTGAAGQPVSGMTDAEREQAREFGRLKALYDADEISPREFDERVAALRGEQWPPPAPRAKRPQSLAQLLPQIGAAA